MFMLTIPPFSFHALDLRCRRCWFPLAVLAANLLCRLPDPTLFLGRMHSFIKRDGVSTWRAALGLQTCLAGCLPVECWCPGCKLHLSLPAGAGFGQPIQLAARLDAAGQVAGRLPGPGKQQLH